MNPPDPLHLRSSAELLAALHDRQLTAVELVEAVLARIEATDERLGAFVEVADAQALDRARHADAELAAGRPLGALHGLPVAIKDLDEVAGLRTTFGSVPLRDHVSTASSTFVERLLGAGAIVVGKTNTPELGHKAVTDNAIRGACSTPFDLTGNAGGSSGGSAAAVAAGQVPLAPGGDGGGSIRIPAALCGAYGLKATFGRVAQATRPHGFGSHMPFVHVGPITRTVEDAAIALQVMAGHVAADPFSAPDDGADFVAALDRPVAGMRVAYLPGFGGYPVEQAVADRVAAGVRALEAQGAEVELVEAPMPLAHDEVTQLWLRQMAIGWAGVVAAFRASGVDLLGAHRDAVTPELLAAVEAAERRTVRETHEDLIQRTRIVDWVEGLFAGFDVVASPTVGVGRVANEAGGRTLGPSEVAGSPVERSIGWTLTIPLNFSGHPAASVPVGFTPTGHPVGMQLAGRRFADADVITASAAVERELPWRDSYARTALDA